MSPRTIIHRLGELLEPCGHYRCGRTIASGSVPTGPYVAAWTTVDPWRYLCLYSAEASSPDAACEELADLLVDMARVQADTWERDPQHRNRAGDIRLVLMEIAIVRAGHEVPPADLAEHVVDGIERMRSRGEL